MNKSHKKPVLLLILDGWGHRIATDSNAIHHANTPTWDRLWQQAPHALLSCSGTDVGLPAGQMGNSEVGHTILGSGRVVYQSLTRIDRAIENGEFADNPAYLHAIDHAVTTDNAVHILGLASPGGIHSHQHHIEAMIELAASRGAKKVYLHAFLDGRDTPPRSAQATLGALTDQFDRLGCGRIASIIGRYYAMDRDQRWQRTQAAYDLLTASVADYQSDSAVAGLLAAYQRDENDEFVSATVIRCNDQPAATIKDHDSVIVMNFRADRARQLSHAFVDQSFDGFTRACLPQLAHFVTTTRYDDTLDASCAFPPEPIEHDVGEVMEAHDKTQLRIAETEKYAHVTFFFSGGREEPYIGEQRILVPSPQVATYDLKPEMSAPAVTEQLVDAIRSGQYDAIVCNYANGDMVGHSGNFNAAVQAVEVLDHCLQQVTDAILAVDGDCIITADHGNCEQMYDKERAQAHTQHTTELVPFVYVGKRAVKIACPHGTLADVAPSLLALMGIKPPVEMSGQSLLITL